MKNLKNLGQTLSKTEQRTINGGALTCGLNNECQPSTCTQADGFTYKAVCDTNRTCRLELC